MQSWIPASEVTGLKLLDRLNEGTGDQMHLLVDIAKNSSNIRITVIGEDGLVKYDTSTKIDLNENHRNRPEIADAFAKGKGKSIRTSTTINKSNYYYAVLLDSGDGCSVGQHRRKA